MKPEDVIVNAGRVPLVEQSGNRTEDEGEHFEPLQYLRFRG